MIETERLLLRELTQADLPAVCDTLQNDEVRRVYEHDFTGEEAAAWIDRQRARYERYGFGLWAAQLRGGETIGMAGLTLQPCEGEEVLEIGYQLRPAYRGQGYAREAAAYIPRFRHIRLTRQSFGIPLREAGRIASLGMSNSLNRLAITLVQIVLNNSLTYYGAMTVYGSDIPLASCGIVMKTNAILIGVIVGLSQGSQPIIGFNYGAKQMDRVWATYRLAVTCNLLISAVGFVLFQFFPRQLISLFGTGSPEYFEFAVRFMRTFLFMVLVNGVQILSSNFFTAIGKAPRGVFLSLTRQVLFLIPLILILPFFFGLDGILYAAPIADGMAFVVTTLFMASFYRQTKREAAA